MTIGLWLLKLFPYHPGATAVVGWIIALPAGMVASLLQNASFPIPWILGVSAEAVSIFLLLSVWVFFTRNRTAKPYSARRRAAILSLLPVNFFFGFVLLGYLNDIRPPLASPTKLTPGHIQSAKAKLPGGVAVDFDLLAFARGRLYVASNIGLIEVEGTQVTAVYQWHSHSRIDGVWSGPKGQSLWLQHAVTSDLSILDDQGWRNISLPTPERGYTRGDMLSGIKIATTESDVWLSGGSSVWKWGQQQALWNPVPLPGMKSNYETVEVYGSSNVPLVVKGANQMFGSNEGVALLTASTKTNWTETKIDECCVKDLTTIADRSYFRGTKGTLARISDGRVEAVAAPGRVEAISADTGKLIVSVADVGIFSFDGEWKKLFDAPYPHGVEESWVHLAARDGVIALSVVQSSSSTETIRRDGLWVSDGQKMVKVTVPE